MEPVFENDKSSSVAVSRYLDQENFTSEKEIFEALIDSKSQGTVIGITSSLLGRTMYLTGVVDLVLGDHSIVVLHAYDTNGYILPETKIPLDSIKAVRSFASKFENPYVSKLNEEQNPLLF
ncbi:hypothetical protein [Pseudochryseolinea flava]|uniref:Uncharacterized protein n=1 Tax=Pseudochryseolinea flava TaxID=2059302 RepID=A0A364XZV7_9BACT|nr:hypothetical protein [Pseudochryseolinea flava]RAV99540.1 hypothetical protein DQQ10_18220 [Pseudochryseolinea flava]